MPSTGMFAPLFTRASSETAPWSAGNFGAIDPPWLAEIRRQLCVKNDRALVGLATNVLVY